MDDVGIILYAYEEFFSDTFSQEQIHVVCLFLFVAFLMIWSCLC